MLEIMRKIVFLGLFLITFFITAGVLFQKNAYACDPATEVETALGCVSTDPSTFVGTLLGWAIGIAGGIAFLLIVFGGFQVVTSSGDPEKLNNGKEIIVSAMAGVLMIVFSVILLKIIGVDILHIPGL